VVDLYGAKKPSWEALRHESSPIAAVRISGKPAALRVTITARDAVPAYPLRDYEIRGVAYGFGQIPVERIGTRLETLAPGASAHAELRFSEPEISRIQVDGWRSLQRER